MDLNFKECVGLYILLKKESGGFIAVVGTTDDPNRTEIERRADSRSAAKYRVVLPIFG